MGIWSSLFGKKSPEMQREAERQRSLKRAEKEAASLDPKNAASLYEAASQGDADLVRLLLDRGASVDAKVSEATGMGLRGDVSYFEDTPLRAAVGKEHLAVVQILLEKGAHAEHPTSHGTQNPSSGALGDAAVTGNSQIAKLLLKHGANPNGAGDTPPLHRAASAGHVEMIKLLLEAGADIHRRITGDWASHPQAIHKAVDSGKLAAVELLLKKGADPNADDESSEDGDTSLDIVHKHLCWQIEAISPKRRVPFHDRAHEYPAAEMLGLLERHSAHRVGRMTPHYAKEMNEISVELARTGDATGSQKAADAAKCVAKRIRR
jgi:ankyrin repeat protein